MSNLSEQIEQVFTSANNTKILFKTLNEQIQKELGKKLNKDYVKTIVDYMRTKMYNFDPNNEPLVNQVKRLNIETLRELYKSYKTEQQMIVTQPIPERTNQGFGLNSNAVDFDAFKQQFELMPGSNKRIALNEPIMTRNTNNNTVQQPPPASDIIRAEDTKKNNSDITDKLQQLQSEFKQFYNSQVPEEKQQGMTLPKGPEIPSSPASSSSSSFEQAINESNINESNNNSINNESPGELVSIISQFLTTFKTQQETFLFNIEQNNNRINRYLEELSDKLSYTPSPQPQIIEEEPASEPVILRSNIYNININSSVGILELPPCVIKSISIQSICIEEDNSESDIELLRKATNKVDIYTSLNDKIPFGYLLANNRREWKKHGYFKYTRSEYPMDKNVNFTVNKQIELNLKYPVMLNGNIVIELIYQELPLVDMSKVTLSLEDIINKF
jgi:hypothetical protein